MAMEPSDPINSENKGSGFAANGHANHNGHTDSDSSYIDDGDNSNDEDDSGKTSSSYHVNEFQRLALACDDGFVRLYNVPESGALAYYRSLPRVSGTFFKPTRSSIIDESPVTHSSYAKQLHSVHCFRWSASKLQVLFLHSEIWGYCFLPGRMYRQHSINKGTSQN